MTQTTGAMNTVDAQVEVSANGTAWTDISGSTNKVSVSPQTADVGEAATLDGQYMIGTAGKLKPVDIDITVLYTESATEGYRLINTQADLAGRPLYVRFIPSRGTGNLVYTTSNAAGAAAAGIITQRPYPGADAATAAPTMLAFKVRATRLLVSSNQPSASASPSASISPSPSSG